MKVSKLSYVIAVVIAVIAGVAVYFYQTTADERALAGNQATTVLIAKGDIAAGTKLADAQTQGLLTQQSYPSAALPQGTVTTVDSTNQDLVLNHAVTKGHILLGAELGTRADATSQIVVPDGKVAISVNVDDPSRVANFLVPGSRVILYYTSADNSKQSVLLPEVDVLAVGATSTANAGAAPQAVSSLITLAVDNLQAKKIILAQKNGSIYFGLLNKTTLIDPGQVLDIKQLPGSSSGK